MNVEKDSTMNENLFQSYRDSLERRKRLLYRRNQGKQLMGNYLQELRNLIVTPDEPQVLPLELSDLLGERKRELALPIVWKAIGQNGGSCLINKCLNAFASVHTREILYRSNKFGPLCGWAILAGITSIRQDLDFTLLESDLIDLLTPDLRSCLMIDYTVESGKEVFELQFESLEYTSALFESVVAPTGAV